MGAAIAALGICAFARLRDPPIRALACARLAKKSKVIPHKPRIPARQNGQAHPEQYSASSAGALPHEPEAISEEEQRLESQRRRELHDQIRWRDRQRQDVRQMASKLKDLEKQASRSAISIERELGALHACIVDLERKVKPPRT